MHSLKPAPPWEQLGISETEFNERQQKANALADMLKEEFGDPVQPTEITAIREQTKDLPPLDVFHSGKPTKPERKIITVNFISAPEVYMHIRKCAASDDRTPATWLRRYLAYQHAEGMLPEVTK